VRTAFLALTKQFHPARFGRMSTELQRLSNEVFLGIKTAHDQLLKQLGVARRGAAGQSGGIPAIKPTGPVTRPSSPAIPRTTTPLQPVTRPPTPLSGTATVPRAQGSQSMPARPATPQPTRPATPQPARTTPAMGMPIQRPTGARPSTPPLNRPGTPPSTTRPPAPANYNPETIRHSGAPAFDERTAHREAMILLNEQDWTKARQTLQTLAQHRPQSKNYGALLAYARGREAQKLGRIADAALEYQRALELEPDLAMAKQALAEVKLRR
jgi:hypothetical protein